jgi:two-component system sensor histidine kinase QseC
MMHSIRVRLLFFVGGLMILAWLGTAASSLYSARKEVQELFDAHLAQSARVLHAMLRHEISEVEAFGLDNRAIVLDTSVPGHFYEGKFFFTVRDGKGEAWYRSLEGPELEIEPEVIGFSDITDSSQQWRVYLLRDKVLNISIEVVQSYEIRNQLIWKIAQQVIWPFAIVIPVILLSIWIGAGRGLRPLKTVADEVRDRNPNNLEEIDLTKLPTEIAPLFISLNSLLGRLDKALSNERGFTSDAAHELRTPLAGIRAQAQVAVRAKDEKEKDTALRHIILGIDNATHLVRQMLMLARLDPDIPIRNFNQQDLTRILTDVAADVASLAVAKDIDLEVRQSAEQVMVQGQAEALSVLIRNLLDNAVRYTPSGGWVKASITQSIDGAVLKIIDSGPGIANKDKDRIFDRFYRGLGTGQTGSGLGLSIVKRVVDLHHAKLEFQTGSGKGKGVMVKVTFPIN